MDPGRIGEDTCQRRWRAGWVVRRVFGALSGPEFGGERGESACDLVNSKWVAVNSLREIAKTVEHISVSPSGAQRADLQGLEATSLLTEGRGGVRSFRDRLEPESELDGVTHEERLVVPALSQ